ncbi:hypothetical protein ACIQYZ_13585 [Rhodococcus erythropolis]
MASKSATVEWISPKEYASRMGLHKDSVYYRLKRGLIPGAVQAAEGFSYRIPVPIEPSAEYVA